MGVGQSIFKKAKTLATKGIDSAMEGRNNYENPKPATEAKAEARAKTCAGCELFVDEPVSFLKVKDERLPQLSNKMCGGCGCSSPYLLRQDSKLCKQW